MVIHVALGTAFHMHPTGAVTLKLLVPPAAWIVEPDSLNV